MNKIKKWLKYFVGFLFVALAVTGCTANFCSNKDVACKWYATYGSVENRNALITEAEKTTEVPHNDFWVTFDKETVNFALAEYNAHNETKKTIEDVVSDEAKNELLTKYGYVIYLDDNYSAASSNDRVLWKNFDKVVSDYASSSAENAKKAPTSDFITYYKNTLQNSTQAYRTCITPEDGQYGAAGSKVDVEAKTWGDAWGKGLIEGLFVYPISWGVHQLSNLFGANGWGQLLAIVVITIIVRGLMMLVTFKSTAAQTKMTALQPELARLQEKYPNADSNQYEKQRLAQAQMELYKKNGINPFSQLLVLIIQFPVFIAVWSALQGAAILSSDSVLGLELSASLGKEMINFQSTSCITAIVLFLLMSGTQLVSMKLPQWMQKKATKNVSRMGKNPSVDKTQSQTKMMSNIMLVMIIVMGISLPSAMGVYWLISALFSICQTLITQKIIGKKKTK